MIIGVDFHSFHIILNFGKGINQELIKDRYLKKL